MIYSVDTETCLITEFDKAPPLVCVSYAGEDGSKGLLRWDEAKQKVAEILTHHTWLGANAPYDMAVIARQFPDLIPLIWDAYAEDRVRDIQIEAKLTDIANGESTKRSYSLATLMEECFGIKRDKSTWRLKYGELRNIPIRDWPEGARQYPLDDAADPLKLLREGGLHDSPDKFRQARHGWWTHLLGVWGIQTDPVRVAALRNKLETDREKLLSSLVASGIIRKDGSQDTKATKARLENTGGKLSFTEPSARFPTGQLCIDAEALRDSGDPVLEAMAKYASIRKQLSTDIPNLERGEIHTRYDSLKDTGRVGSGGKDATSPTGTAFNLTNLPRKGGIRECFVPRAGKIFFDADYKALEAYTGAQACLWLVGESSLADLLNRDEDYHIHTASAYEGISYEEGLKRKKAKDERVTSLRQICKVVNYSLAGGGMQPMLYGHVQTELKKDEQFELAKMLTREVSDGLWQAWRTRYAEWPKYFARHKSMVRGGGCRIEHPVSKRVRTFSGYGAYTQINNAMFQSLGADAAKDAGFRSSRECYDPSRNSVMFGSRLVLFGHDSLTGETDPVGAHEVAMRLKEVMESVSEVWCPDVPLKTDPCLSTYLSKSAEAVYVEGRLLPCF